MEFTMKRILLLAFVFTTQVLYAQWSTDPSINNAICTQPGNQYRNQIISDGGGGAIISWVNGAYEIFAQLINSDGINDWATNGVQVCPPTYNSNVTAKMVSDGNGGAIFIYQTFPSESYLLAQHLNSSGVLQWSTPGVLVAPLNTTTTLEITSDGSGGAIVIWIGFPNYNVYAQRINASGLVQWDSIGIPVTNDAFTDSHIKLVKDDNGGAIIAWKDYRSGTAAIYAQKVSSAGEMQWPANGVAVTNLAVGSSDFQLTNEGGGAIFSWQSAIGDIYAQKLNSSGLSQWTADGAVICAAANAQLLPQLVSDGIGGAIITWEDGRNGGSQGPRDIYAQRIDSNGSIVWPLDGVAICQSAAYKLNPQLSADDSSGATILWTDSRNDPQGQNLDIYAQRINASGTVLWAINGVAVCTATLKQNLPIIINDENGGTISTWQDLRNLITGGYDIFAQRVNSDGTLGGVTDVNENISLQPSEFSLNQNYPNPFNPSTTISFSIPNEEFVSLRVFNSLGEEVADLVNETKPAGNYYVSFDASELTSGVYFYKISAGSVVDIKKMMLIK
jgi:hypothetical protein